ncbi:cytochrome P450, family 87, subfamily A, polypeptide 7 [Actinidia rufa]|uniref:Cytochrome P450, family 87, subfamily A, polypeptide 7 n=1 Tax=Actinidia rufa TaxID=165716 RepID=A0A7J0FCF6_9ERIC|nr:cytochrome P450, family 87, subfamily A, polypeptide 7 [Actinidia rufa]
MIFIHAFRHKLYSDGRKWAYDVLKKKLIAAEAESEKDILVQDHFQHAVFCLLAYMCFGDKLKETIIREIEAVQRPILTNFIRFNVLNFMPRLGKIVFRKRWKELLQIRRNQEDVLLPLIRARQEKIKHKGLGENQGIVCYVDTLFDLQLPKEDSERKFSEGEIVSLCSEYINGGTDTSTTTLQWVMANLVKHQDVQEKLVREINRVVKRGEDIIKEEDLIKMPYLKAIVLETLRRHPPGHFILPRAVTEDTVLDGYDIPTNAMVNFTVADMAWDPNVWEDPMEFRPERFYGDNGEVEFDLKGVKEIKMMPFGAGRRVCPAISLAILHQQYFVANLVRDFKWEVEDGEDVDLSEKQDFTMIMKNPLRTRISPRINDS